MSTDGAMVIEGVVLAEHRGGFFEIDLPTLRRKVLAKKSGRLIKAKIRLVAGDRVRVDLGVYDPSRGRTVWRT